MSSLLLGWMCADGWGFSQMQQVNSLKMSVIGGIHAAQYFRSEYMLQQDRYMPTCYSYGCWNGVL